MSNIPVDCNGCIQIAHQVFSVCWEYINDWNLFSETQATISE